MRVIVGVGWCAALACFVAAAAAFLFAPGLTTPLAYAGTALAFAVSRSPFPFRRAPKPQPPMIAFLDTPASRTHASRSVVDPWAEWH